MTEYIIDVESGEPYDHVYATVVALPDTIRLKFHPEEDLHVLKTACIDGVSIGDRLKLSGEEWELVCFTNNPSGDSPRVIATYPHLKHDRSEWQYFCDTDTVKDYVV